MEIVQLPNLSPLSYLSFSISPVPVGWLLCLCDHHNTPPFSLTITEFHMNKTGQSWELVNKKGMKFNIIYVIRDQQ